jgi:Tfp pilus assembly protein PilW
MPRLTPRTARLAGWIAIPVALLTSGLVISQASYSAFSSVASNPASNWTAGSVAIADDDAGSALFTGTKCITVTSSGSLASLVKLYGVGSTTTNGLSSFITLTVTQGTGGNFGSCTGFTPLATGSAVFSGTLAAFGTTATNYATGLGTWAPTGASPETRVYRLTYTVDAAAPNTSQNGTAAIAFTWEAQNS